jgi:UDP-N-acetylmuramoyl-L-alanyl-D-glutamate--2,6-diaminopimelate ligase
MEVWEMTLFELFRGMRHEICGDGSIQVKDMQYDSRGVGRGDLFFCISGYTTDGHRFAARAVSTGAAAVVVTKYQEGLDVTQVLVDDGRAAMSLCAQKFFGYPARRMKMVGVTGTNGKTTTTYMLKHIAEQADIKTGLIGTIVNLVGGEQVKTERTTPESIDLQRLLRRMADEGCTLAVMEVSSHSLTLKRVYGMEFDVGIFTNLTQDHLDFHKTWAEYADAKSLLFEQSQISVVNIDDDSAANMMGAARRQIIHFGVTHPAQYTAGNIAVDANGVSYEVDMDGHPVHISVRIPGMFTVYNSLGAAVAAHALGVRPYHIEQGLKGMPSVAGRFESLDTRGQGYSVILDYAHTPDSLESTLRAIREFAPARVLTVFGCGGNRDAGKRPQMGGIAARLSDFVVLTSDNPRFEEPQSIIDQIEAGVKDAGGVYTCIENRRKAIEYAMRHARKDDIVLLAGKGHETYQEIRGVKYDFDEKVVVSELFDGMGVKKPKEKRDAI